MGNRASSEWTERLFVREAKFFLAVFRYRQGTGQEVEGLTRIIGEFKVPRRGRVLDLPCGVGRHAVPLAKIGYSVTGLDLSPVFIGRANAYARKQKVARRTTFYTGDIRDLEGVLKEEEPFDAIINLWSSIGYYGEEEDLRMFRALKTLASRRCLLVVDSINRDSVVLRPREVSVSGLGRFQLHETRKLNLENSMLESVWRFYEKKRGDLKLKAEVPFVHRVYSLHELRDLLERAGWRYRKCYGDFNLQPFGRESHRIIACCVA